MKRLLVLFLVALPAAGQDEEVFTKADVVKLIEQNKELRDDNEQMAEYLLAQRKKIEVLQARTNCA